MPRPNNKDDSPLEGYLWWLLASIVPDPIKNSIHQSFCSRLTCNFCVQLPRQPHPHHPRITCQAERLLAPSSAVLWVLPSWLWPPSLVSSTGSLADPTPLPPWHESPAVHQSPPHILACMRGLNPRQGTQSRSDQMPRWHCRMIARILPVENLSVQVAESAEVWSNIALKHCIACCGRQ